MREINGMEYCSISEAAKSLSISSSTLRKYLETEWLTRKGVECKPEEFLRTPSGYRYISSHLVEKLKPLMYMTFEEWERTKQSMVNSSASEQQK